jgi:hypothetical protein
MLRSENVSDGPIERGFFGAIGQVQHECNFMCVLMGRSIPLTLETIYALINRLVAMIERNYSSGAIHCSLRASDSTSAR